MGARRVRKPQPRRVGQTGAATSPRRPWDNPRLKIILLAVAMGILVVGSIAIMRWNAINRLSRQSPAMFAAEIEAAAGDGRIGTADIELLQELQSISALEESSVPGRSLCVGVGTAPLFRGFITDEDRRDMTLVRDFLLPRRGRPSADELAAFLRENPRIEQTFRTYKSSVEQGVTRRRGAQTP